jgi:hypothetical protein
MEALMENIKSIDFYKYKKNIGVVECMYSGNFLSLKDAISDFLIEDKKLLESDWQAVYMEQYFSSDRATKLCETYDEPADDAKGFIIVFFIYDLKVGQVLRTPFGNYPVIEIKKVPKEYKRALEFEPFD